MRNVIWIAMELVACSFAAFSGSWAPSVVNAPTLAMSLGTFLTNPKLAVAIGNWGAAMIDAQMDMSDTRSKKIITNGYKRNGFQSFHNH